MQQSPDRDAGHGQEADFLDGASPSPRREAEARSEERTLVPAGASDPTDSHPDVTVAEEAYPTAWMHTGGHDQEPPSGGGGWDDDGEPESEAGKMSFLDHLEELRRRIIYSLIAIGAGIGVAWIYADELYAAIAFPLTSVLRELKLPDELVYTNPTAPFTLYVQLAMVAGIFIAAPFVVWQLWRFISPGLYPHEKRYAIPFVFLCSALFIAGGAFAYVVAFPAALRFLLSFAHQFRPMITVNEYFSLALTVILGLGIVFELPVLILLLTLLRVVTPGFLLRNVRYAVLLIFIAAAVITPTPDIPTMMVFAAPLIALYFFGIGLSYLVVRARRRKQES